MFIDSLLCYVVDGLGGICWKFDVNLDEFDFFVMYDFKV